MKSGLALNKLEICSGLFFCQNLPFFYKKFNFKLLVERELPGWAVGIAEKHVACDQYYLDDESPVSKLAFQFYQNRLEKQRQEGLQPNTISSEEDRLRDLRLAKQVITVMYAIEEIKKRGLSLREHKTSDIIPTYNMEVVMIDTSHD